MRKETVVATLRASVSLTDEFHEYMSTFDQYPNAWFARDGGDAFLAELGGEWNEIFISTAQDVLTDYFVELGLDRDRVPSVVLTDSRRGSWEMEAALTMFGTVGSIYTILKAISELPKIADGLEEVKKRLQKELVDKFKKKIPERIEPFISSTVQSAQVPNSVRVSPVRVTCSIDARPMRALTADATKTQSIHLSVSISRSSVVVENLSDKPILNLKIGLFKSPFERNQWSFGEAYSKMVNRLSGKQSLSLSIGEFIVDSSGDALDLSDEGPLYVDCWIQDSTGIFLFNFNLE